MYGKIEETLNILHHKNKGSIMNSREQFHIQRLTKDNLQLNDAYTESHFLFNDHVIQVT
jgi:hypothetical protein